MIEGIRFYNHLYPLLEKAPNLDLIQAEILKINTHDKYTEVTTKEITYRGDKVFSSCTPTTFHWLVCQNRRTNL